MYGAYSTNAHGGVPSPGSIREKIRTPLVHLKDKKMLSGQNQIDWDQCARFHPVELCPSLVTGLQLKHPFQNGITMPEPPEMGAGLFPFAACPVFHPDQRQFCFV